MTTKIAIRKNHNRSYYQNTKVKESNFQKEV